MPRFRGLPAGSIAEKKSSIDLVTEADLLSEKYISETLKTRFPNALIVGEEACEVDPGLIPALKGAELAFVIDPVDGTFNFQAGLPVFGINLAVVQNGETVAGLIHDPVMGDTLMAVKGGGTRLVRASGEEQVCRVRTPAAMSEMVGTISINDLDRESRVRIAGNLAKTRMAFAYNCSAYEYWLVATGKVHFIGHYKLMPWDHLAGVLIHEEAGGVTAKFDGSPYRPGEVNGGILSAPDAESWNLILAEIVRA
ncbi:inositol monophosphatase [Rhizobium sp. C1]|nr:inositol monophosphatase [Rhizobium sp. C1]MCD2176690.1 inositol monophosphatase [Rhizobium sp. C1]